MSEAPKSPREKYQDISWLTTVSWAISSAVTGCSLTALIFRLWPAHAPIITLGVIIVLTCISFAVLSVVGVRLRGWRKELRQQREEIIKNYDGVIDQILQTDPIAAARAKMRMREGWPVP